MSIRYLRESPGGIPLTGWITNRPLTLGSPSISSLRSTLSQLNLSGQLMRCVKPVTGLIKPVVIMPNNICRFGLLLFVALESCSPGTDKDQSDAGIRDKMNDILISVDDLYTEL